MLKAGVAKIDITPPTGVRMAGFGGRSMPSLGLHDPLWARALVLDADGRRAGLLVMDVLYARENIVSELRAEAAAAAGIEPDGLLVASTHTHSGPGGTGDEATEQERSYWDSVPEKLSAVIAEAAADLTPAAAGAASGWSAVGVNRREEVPGGRIELGRNHFGVFDTELGVMRVEQADGTPLAAVMNYACHAVCLMEDSYLISADYPGFARHLLEEKLGGGTALFFNGACGNVNPREAAVDHGLVSGSGFRIAERAGREIAREAARVWAKTETRADVSIGFARRQIELPTNWERAIGAAERMVADLERSNAPKPPWSPYVTWYNPPDLDASRKRLADLKERAGSPVACEIQAVRVGPAAFIGWPGEVFCDLGMELKRRSPFHPTYVIGYANGSIGYVPTPEAFPEGGYEAESAAHLADNAGLVLVEESLSLLESLA